MIVNDLEVIHILKTCKWNKSMLINCSVAEVSFQPTALCLCGNNPTDTPPWPQIEILNIDANFYA